MNFNTVRTKLINYKDNIVFFFIMVTIFMPFFLTIIYSVPFADDFSMAIKNYSFGECINATIYRYLNWTGGFLGMFIEYFFNPLQFGHSYGHACGVILLLIFISFFLACYYLIKSVITFVLGKRNTNLIRLIYILFVVTFLNTAVYKEIFYWFVGSISVIFIVFSFIDIALILNLYNSNNHINLYKRCTILSLASFIAGLGVFYSVSIVIVYSYMLYNKKNTQNQKIVIYDIIPIIFMFIAWISYFISPGNFARHEVATGDKTINIWRAILYSYHQIMACLRELLNNPFFYAWLLAIVFLGIVNAEKMESYKIVMSFIISSAIVFFMVFPICLGYDGVEYFPNRNIFKVNLYIVLWITVPAYSIGKYWGYKIKTERIPRWVYAITFIFLLVANMDYLSECPWIYTASNVGNVVKEADYFRNILKELESSEYSNVVIERSISEKPEQTGILEDYILLEDPKNWVNEDISKWYEKESVVIVWTE